MATALGFVSYLFTGFGILTPDAPIVEISTGKIQGISRNSRDGYQYFEYLGIPYAKAPVNGLRFEPPVPIESWKGILKAKEFGTPCLQYDTMLYGKIIGSEDCLFINVFTPRIQAQLPVLVNFHGGRFTGGDSSYYGAKYFMDEDIIVVTMNFRLHALGFLNTGDDLIRGNMGLKDQNLALRWIQANIKKFGGDPDRVTIMGSGTGGVSVHYHILSPLSKGLFSKAISQSGNAACPWAFIRDPAGQARAFGKHANCPTRNTTALVKCLKKKKARDLIQLAQNLMSPVHPQEDFFTGSVEAVKREDTFLHESPFDILELGNFNKVPLILGINSGEGGYKVARLLAYPEIQQYVGRRWKEYSPIFGHYDPNKTEVSDKLRQYYFGDSQYLNPGYDLPNMQQLISDGNYFHPNHYTAIRHARYAPTFLFYFTYQTIRFPNICSAYKAVRHDDWFPADIKVVGSVAKDIARNYGALKNAEPIHDWGVCSEQQLPLLWNSNFFSEIWKSSPDYYFSRALVSTVAYFVGNEGNKLKFDGVPWPSIGSRGPPLMYMNLDRPPRMIDEPFARYMKIRTGNLPLISSIGIVNLV